MIVLKGLYKRWMPRKPRLLFFCVYIIDVLSVLLTCCCVFLRSCLHVHIHTKTAGDGRTDEEKMEERLIESVRMYHCIFTLPRPVSCIVRMIAIGSLLEPFGNNCMERPILSFPLLPFSTRRKRQNRSCNY